MLRSTIIQRCFPGIKETHRVGIFPLHLDPPTIQHCEIFRLLVGKGMRNGHTSGGSSSSGRSGSSSLSTSEENVDVSPSSLGGLTYPVPPASSKELSFGRLRGCALNDSISCDSFLRRSRSLEHFDEFEKILSESALVPFDHLILVPNTKFPVTLRQTVHVAAMSVLATRDLPRVHVELKALEHPDSMMPIVYELTCKYPKSTIVHWLPNVYEMQNWKHFEEMARRIPFLLLRPRGWRSVSEAAAQEKEEEAASAAAALHAAASAAATCANVSATHASINSSSSSSNGADSSSYSSMSSSSSGPKAPSAASSSSHAHASVPFGNLEFISDQRTQQTLMPRQWDTSSNPMTMEILEVPRMSGSYVRQELWETSTDPFALIPPAVLRYIDSHGLYRDFRKGACNSRYTHGSSAGNSRVSKSNTVVQGNLALVAFDGLIPRLELHYDPNNLLAREQYNKLKAFECLDGRDPDLIVPIGGDGYFMHCVRKNWRRFIPFFGVNAGHVGYLLNDCATLEELFSAPLKLHSLSMLYCEAETENATGEKEILEELAFNDAWVERASGQTVLIRILVNGEERIRRVRGDGVLVSTAAGSTAYAQALGASPVPVGAPLIQLVGSNIVSPAQWKPVHLNQEDCVEFECTDNHKRPCRGFVDSVDVGNVSRMLIRTSRVGGVQVAFADSCDLQQKLYKLQFPKSY